MQNILPRIDSSVPILPVGKNSVEPVKLLLIIWGKHVQRTKNISKQKNVATVTKFYPKAIRALMGSKPLMMSVMINSVIKLPKKVVQKYTNASIHA